LFSYKNDGANQYLLARNACYNICTLSKPFHNKSTYNRINKCVFKNLVFLQSDKKLEGDLKLIYVIKETPRYPEGS